MKQLEIQKHILSLSGTSLKKFISEMHDIPASPRIVPPAPNSAAAFFHIRHPMSVTLLHLAPAGCPAALCQAGYMADRTGHGCSREMFLLPFCGYRILAYPCLICLCPASCKFSVAVTLLVFLLQNSVPASSEMINEECVPQCPMNPAKNLPTSRYGVFFREHLGHPNTVTRWGSIKIQKCLTSKNFITMKQIENNFQVTGFVGKDAEIRSFENAAVARFSLAISHGQKSGQMQRQAPSAIISSL